VAARVPSRIYPSHTETRLAEALADSPVGLIHGPRQFGRTPLARMAWDPRGFAHFTLDDDVALAAARADPVGFVADLPERTILDEVQRGARELAGIEVKAPASVTAEDFRGLRKLREAARESICSGRVAV